MKWVVGFSMKVDLGYTNGTVEKAVPLSSSQIVDAASESEARTKVTIPAGARIISVDRLPAAFEQLFDNLDSVMHEP